MQFTNRIPVLLLSVILLGRAVSSQCEVELFAPPVGAPDDRFGYDVAVDGRTLLVSAINDDDAASNAGAVFVYVHAVEGPSGQPADDSWTWIQKLTASDAGSGDEFGHAGHSGGRRRRRRDA